MTPFLWGIALLFVFFLGLIIGGWIEHKIMVRGLNRVVNPDPTRFVSQHVPNYCDHQWVTITPGGMDFKCKHCGAKVVENVQDTTK